MTRHWVCSPSDTDNLTQTNRTNSGQARDHAEPVPDSRPG